MITMAADLPSIVTSDLFGIHVNTATEWAVAWRELIRIVDSPSFAAEGVQDTAIRFLLLLPLLTDPDVPETASARLMAALAVVGAPQDTAPITAEHLMAHLTTRSRHDPTWASPLSGS
ncbi:hypothetical protein ABZX82_32685 [Streptomyces griseoflavus]|uniref:hypothetical protein n=1 Tax=Streptomyces griseoflavus TaxID=35619 RepID=UPI0033BD2E75